MADISRQIAGLLTYNPGPGIYSRLERAIQEMPENVRVPELPGLLKRYKEGVPGWELKATDLDATIAGRPIVPREELLSAVRERSPVYTHREIVLGGDPQMRTFETGATGPAYAQSAGRIGEGRPVGRPKFKDYGQGGEHYGELLLLQPDAGMAEFGSHWKDINAPGAHNAVAHARFDTHGDALRINELQSDLGIHNRKARETQPVGTGSWTPEVVEDLEARGVPHWFGGENNRLLFVKEDKSLPFPLEDAWADLLIKRLALEAARKGHRAIEVASPRAIADKVGGNIDNYEHFYGKVVPGALERLGRKMGGLERHNVAEVGGGGWSDGPWRQEKRELRSEALSQIPPSVMEQYDGLVYALRSPDGGGPMLDRQQRLTRNAQSLAEALDATGRQSDSLMPGIMQLAQRHAGALDASQISSEIAGKRKITDHAPAIRYIMSDEMRRRLIQQGVGAAVAGGIMSQDDLIERLGQ